MRAPSEHIKTLQRRIDFLRAREHKNSFDAAEIGSLEWAIVNLDPQRQWVGLTDEEKKQFVVAYYPSSWDRKTAVKLMDNYEAYLKEMNT